MDKLGEAQRKTEATMDKLGEAQRKTEEARREEAKGRAELRIADG